MHNFLCKYFWVRSRMELKVTVQEESPVDTGDERDQMGLGPDYN